jgi:putative acetyltransferase
LFVSPKAQRKGVASRLLEFSSNIFTKSNFQKIEVDASHMALPFFKKKGFKIVRNNLVDINGILLENFSMEKFLA